MKKVPTVGFEPTRTNTGHLKCLPLDLLGHVGEKFYKINKLNCILPLSDYKEAFASTISSGHCESNTGHFELQSNALPTELYPVEL